MKNYTRRVRYSFTLALAFVFAMATVLVPGTATASPVQQTVIIADAGDSFTSNPGSGPRAESRNVYAPGTSVDGNECFQSSWGYPELIVKRLRNNNPSKTYELHRSSCAGATTDNVLNDWHKTTADGRTVTVPSQISTIPANADYVVMTIGGNDVGFTDFVTCILGGIINPSPECTEASPSIVNARQALQLLQGKVGNALDAIQAKAPHATIIIGGYPQIVPLATSANPGPAYGCLLWLSYGEMAIANSIEIELNAAIKAAAQQSGAVYVEQYKTAPYVTTACSLGLNRQINGIIALAQEAAFHPNNQGAIASSSLMGAPIQ